MTAPPGMESFMNLMIIDGNSIVNRAFYGVRALTAPDGTPTNAVYGFLAIFQRLYDEIKPDILLLDVEMPGMNGMELAKTLRSRSETAQIIFITGFPDYISQGYDVSALHYLLKPVDPEKLFEVLSRAAKACGEKGEPETVVFRAGTENIKLRVCDIEYIAALGHTTAVKAGGKTYDLSISISEAEKMLGDGFIRCHRSYIVGLRYVSSVSGDSVTLDDGTKIPVSRSMRKTVAEEFIRYYRRDAK